MGKSKSILIVAVGLVNGLLSMMPIVLAKDRDEIPRVEAAEATFTMIDFPGAVGTTALGINNAGQVVGTYSLTDPYVNHARQGFFQDTDQSFTTVDFPGSAETLAYGINSSADIAGIYLDGNAAAHGFTRIGGTFATLDFPGAAETEPTGINDHKQVVGAYSFVNSRLTLDLYGFVATPVGGVNANGGTGRPRGGLWP